MIAGERLYLNSLRNKVVRGSDSEAAFLLVPKGGEVPKKYEAMVAAMPKLEPVESRQTRIVEKTSRR